MTLHEILGRMHRFHSTIVSGQLLDYSNNAEKACSSEPTGDLGNLNRLRFFVQTFYVKTGCDTFSLPCQTCGMAKAAHPGPTRCEYLPTPKGICVCGKSQPSHPWFQDACQDCRCGSKEDCLLFLVKSFAAHGGRECVLNLLLGNGDDPLWVLLGNSPLQQTLHRWCLHLLWLLANIPPPSFSACWGGSLIKATVDAYQSRKVGLARHEIEFVVIVDGNMSQNIIRKKSAALIAFQEQIREWLKGSVDIPEVGKAKGKVAEVAETIKASANAMFQILSVPYNFHNLLNVQKARELFFEFLEIDTRHMQTSKNDFILWISEYEQRFRPRRNLPGTILSFLVNLLTGDVPLGSTKLITDVFSITCEEATVFSISKLQESWLLPHILAAIPAVPPDMAVVFLLELSDFFNRSPSARSRLLLDDKLVTGLLPVLFDQQEDEKRNGAAQSTDYVMPFQLAVDIVADAHVHDILTRAPTKYANEQAWLKSSVEGLLATSLFQIGSYSRRDGNIVPWATRNVEIVQALANGVAVRLNVAVPKFQHMLEHPAWENTLETLNIFHKMTFCPVVPFSTSNDPLETQFLRNLLNKGPVTPQVKNINECRVLLSEHCVATIRILAQGLKLFELMPVDKSPAEVTRLKNTKGAGLAFSAYFRDCLGCFRTVRERSPDDRTKMIAQFFAAYVLDRTYSTEKEARLKLIEDTEARRRLTLMERKDNPVKSEPEDKKQHIRDLETLSGGVTMWLIPKKGKVQQCCVFLQRRGNTKAFRKFADSFVLTLELEHEKTSFVLYEQVTLDIGANDPMLLHKTGLDYAAHMALSLWKDKHCRHLVCTSMDDFECFTRALAVIRSQHLGMGSSAVPQTGDVGVELDPREEEALANVNIHTVKFHQSILLTYRFMHTPITAAMTEFSNRIQHACATSPEAESLGEFNLLRFLVATFQNKTGCEQFQVPCQTCGKGDKAHPGELKCGKYVPVHGAKRCACGKPDTFPHPWTLDSFQDCRCGSQEPCTLFAIKCFLAYGGKDLLLRKLHDKNTEPYVLRWCIHLLWLFSTIPYSSFLRCWGGTYVKVNVETHGKPQGMQGTFLNMQELTFTVDVNLSQTTVRRKFAQIIAFHEQLREMLKGIVQIPEPPRNGKGSTTDMAEVLLEIVSSTFEILKVPANFHKQIGRAHV